MPRNAGRTPWANSIRVAPATEPPVEAAPAEAEFGYYTGRTDQDSGLAAELADLRSLVSRDAVHVGSRTSARTKDALDAIVDSIRSESIDIGAFGPLMQALARNRELVQSLAGLDSFDQLTHLVTLTRHRAALERLKRSAANPSATADTMMELVSKEWWVFGTHLALMPSAWGVDDLPERCLPLVRFDGAVHLVLVESPTVDVVRLGGDGMYAVDPQIYQAFDRARHLVGRLSDRREDIEQRLTFKTARASVSVVIGYPSGRGLSRSLIREKIRELNTFTVGFNVVTYDELISLAEDTLPPVADPDQP